MTTIFVRNLIVARAIPDENIHRGTGRLPFISEFRFGEISGNPKFLQNCALFNER